jgi:hypothetical protein
MRYSDLREVGSIASEMKKPRGGAAFCIQMMSWISA